MTKMQSNMQRHIALCYVRQSVTKDDKDVNSPERQRANILALCERKGWTPEWYEDTGGHKSGRTVKNRPAWLALNNRLKDSDVVALVANDLSRLHRKGWRVGDLIEKLNEFGVALTLAAPGKEQIDTSTVQGRIFAQLGALFDEYYAEDVSAKARDSIRYRRKQGKFVGRVPFGTQRNEKGYLEPSTDGVWLMPDGTFKKGLPDKEPHTDATWRGYYEAAKRAMEIYAAGNMGIARVAYQLDDEGWAYRTVRGKPRVFERDDVRRIVANWREYGGMPQTTKARNRPAYKDDDPSTIVLNPERAVMPIDLLGQVAKIRYDRTLKPRRTRTHNVNVLYPLSVVVRCSHCSSDEETQKRTATLQGYTTSAGVRRYRHSIGMKCTSGIRSVKEADLNEQFEKILDHLIIKPEYIDLMQRIVLEDVNFNQQTEEDDIERQKAEAIAKCRHRLDRARLLFIEGDISEDEYRRLKKTNEQEIQHWEARTVKQQEIIIELISVLGTLTNLKRVWYEGTHEDKRSLVHSIFEYILFDLEEKQITDFRLKPWADQYLIARAAMLAEEQKDKLQNGRDSEMDLRRLELLTSTVRL
ncbi:MAG: recombinase family protein [Anaerolineae bacterium]|nr:recombinase family protein [Anaerolineae bacterium]